MSLEKVESRLQSVFGAYTDAFKSLLNETGAVISGSFIVQAILNEDWENSDIDVYVPKSDELSPHANPSSKIDAWMHSNGWPMNNYHATCRYGDTISRASTITFIRNFSVSLPTLATPSHYAQEQTQRKYSVQMIHTNLQRDEIDDYIKENFDFSICKNIYKISTDGIASLHVSANESILNKQFDFNYSGNIFGSIARLAKYQARGFTISFSRSQVLREIIAFQNEEQASDKERKSSRFIIVAKADISAHNGKIFPIFYKNNIQNYRLSESELLQTATSAREQKSCGKYGVCAITALGFTHFHTDGKHLGHGVCEDLIIVNE